MVNGIVLPIKKVFGLVDSKISVEIKDEGRKLQGRLVAVDEYLNIHMDETIEFIDNQRGRSLGTVVIGAIIFLPLHRLSDDEKGGQRGRSC